MRILLDSFRRRQKGFLGLRKLLLSLNDEDFQQLRLTFPEEKADSGSTHFHTSLQVQPGDPGGENFLSSF